MKKTTAYIATTLLAMTAMMSSCVYDDTDDCGEELRVNFTYDRNMKFADAFDHEVKTVNVYAFDQSGQLALARQETVTGEGFSVDVSQLKVEQPYNFIVWAEGDKRGDGDCYDYGTGQAEQDYSVRMKRSNDSITKDITPLYHGRVTNVSFPRQFGTTQTTTIPLTRDTKNVRVILQETAASGETMSTDDYLLTVTDNNGTLNYDNSLATDNMLTYCPWQKYTGSASADINNEAKTTRAETQVNVLVADFSLNRLMAEGHSTRLNVTDKDGKAILSIPLIDYILLTKDFYQQAMDNQEYLDRQDSYNITFLLSHGTWLNSFIYINSWKVVPPQKEELK